MQIGTRAIWLIFILVLSGCSIDHAIRVDNGQRIGLDQMIAEVRYASVVFIGEQHDVASHHRLQLEVIKGLYKNGKPFSIGVEMFEIDSQPGLDAWIAGKIPEDIFVRVYQVNWHNLDWSLYQDIFRYARDNGIPMVALNPPKSIVHKVSRQGYSSLSSVELRALPPDSIAPVRDEVVQFMMSEYPGHGRNGEAFRHLCEAQMLRNRVMAKGIVRYLSKHPDSSMVVLTGSAHVWGKGGIPDELGALQYKVIIPPFNGISIGNPEVRMADYLLD